jgi:biotin operon repressor
MRYLLKDMPLSTSLLVLVTLFVLAGSVHHVAYTFSTLEGGHLLWGYVQALGIDLGILGLAYGIQLRKRQNRSTTPLWLVLMLVTFISAYANYLYGIMHQQPLETVSAFDRMVVFLRPFLLSVTLPIIMFALIEIIGEDRNYALQLQERAPHETPPMEPLPRPAQETAQAAVSLLASNGRVSSPPDKEMLLEQLLYRLYEHPTITRTQLAAELGCSRKTLAGYLQELEARGYIRRKGNGYETVVTPLPRNGARARRASIPTSFVPSRENP